MTVKEAVKNICSLLNKHKVDCILVGGFAVIHHGYPRPLLIWISGTRELLKTI